MSKKDIITKHYIEDNRIFSDAFNFLLYDGSPVIRPELLHPLDTVETAAPYGTDDAVIPVQRFRDVFKYAAAKRDPGAAYLLLGIENQSDVHYAMPIRNMLYDSLHYASQVESAAKSRRRTRTLAYRADASKSHRSLSSGEYLSGFSKQDHLLPVITLVLFFSAEPWDGPASLHDMFSVRDPELLTYIPDYRLNLITPAAIDDLEFRKFESSLREVLQYIKHSRDKQKLTALLSQNARYQNLDRNAADVINTITNSKLTLSKIKEEVNMCKAIDDIREEAREKGREEGLLLSVKTLMHTLNLKADQAMAALSIPECDRAKYLAKL